MNKKRNCLFLFIAFIFALFYSCKKDDNEAPIIKINLPQTQIALNYCDTISFSVTVSDDKNVQGLSVYIANSALIPVTASWTKEINKPDETVNGIYTFCERYMESGLHYLVVTANDGDLIQKEFVPIQITAMPNRKIGMAITYFENNHWKMGFVDSTFEIISSINLSNKPIDLICNNYSQQIGFIETNGILTTYNINSLEKAWESVSIASNVIPYKGMLDYQYPYIVSSTAMGQIQYFDERGVVRKTITTGSNTQQTENFIISGNNIVSFNKGYSSSPNHLSVSVIEGGGMIQQYLYNENLVAFAPYSDREVLVYTHNAVSTFNKQISYLYPISDLPYDSLFSVFSYNNELQYLFFENKIVRYYPKSNFFQDYSNQTINSSCFDHISQSIYGVSGNSLYEINLQSNQITLIKNYNFEIQLMSIMYAK